MSDYPLKCYQFIPLMTLFPLLDLKFKNDTSVSFLFHEREEFAMVYSTMFLREKYLEEMSTVKFGTITQFDLTPQKVELTDNCEKFGKGLSGCIYEISKPENSTCRWEDYKSF